MPDQPEVWLRGPVNGVPELLQPVAHALLQSVEEVKSLVIDFPEDLLWKKPAGLASVGFHLQHLSGVIDRMCTYAQGLPLSTAQHTQREAEGREDKLSVQQLVDGFELSVQAMLDRLRATDERSLNEKRTVGRKQLPSTVFGLLFHAAEHVQRHVGQLLVTCKLVRII